MSDDYIRQTLTDLKRLTPEWFFDEQQADPFHKNWKTEEFLRHIIALERDLAAAGEEIARLQRIVGGIDKAASIADSNSAEQIRALKEEISNLRESLEKAEEALQQIREWAGSQTVLVDDPNPAGFSAIYRRVQRYFASKESHDKAE